MDRVGHRLCSLFHRGLRGSGVVSLVGSEAGIWAVCNLPDHRRWRRPRLGHGLLEAVSHSRQHPSLWASLAVRTKHFGRSSSRCGALAIGHGGLAFVGSAVILAGAFGMIWVFAVPLRKRPMAPNRLWHSAFPKQLRRICALSDTYRK